MIISFNFIHKELISLKFNNIYRRLERLFIPYFGYPVIILILNKLLYFRFKNEFFTSLKLFNNQILWGNGMLKHFWFLWDLIILTLLYIVILFYFKMNNLFILQLLFIFAYFLQYSGYNKKFYINLKGAKRESLGRFVEMIPFSVTGFIMGNFGFIMKLQNHRFKTFVLSLIIFTFIDKYEIFYNLNEVAYGGIKINIHSIILIFIFAVLPIDKLSYKLIKLIKIITRYSGGIYYIHWSLYIYLNNFISPIKKGTLLGCFIIYLLSYIIIK